jgi:uridine kinase
MDTTILLPIVDAVFATRRPHPLRIGIDGFCASGKTTLADALAAEIRLAGRGVIRASADDFQNPAETRWQLGPRSPEGFVRYQIDFSALRSLLLEPLGPNGSLGFRTSSYDVHASRPNLSVERVARSTDVLVLDGLFLHAKALDGCLDLTVFVTSPVEKCLARALVRNQECVSEPRELESLYREKYIPGFALYCRETAPETKAAIVIRN